VTSPGSGSEHVSRYRALGEFDSLIRAARDARRALRELREEEAKLNSQSLSDDQKITASKQNRARAERESANSAKAAIADLNRGDAAGKAGEEAGSSYHKGLGRGIQRSNNSGGNRQLIQATIKAFQDTFGKAGESAGEDFAKRAEDKINSSLGGRLRTLNRTLSQLKLDPLVLDVDAEDANQSIAAIEFELKKLAHEDTDINVRILSNRALGDIRTISRSLKDELGAEALKDAERIRRELEKIDALPSGKSFRFWALTAMADMTRVFEEADRGTSVFTKLRQAASAGGGGGGFLRSFISGFDDFSESSSRLLQRLGRVSGELYRMPGLIAVLVSAIPALISGIGALGGGALSLASGIGAAGGAIAAIPGLGFAAIGAIGGLTSAFGGFGDVLKEAQKAEIEESQVKEQARLGTDKALTATQKYNLALKDMAPATRDVTKAIVDFSNKWAKTSEIVGENFFKEVVDSTDRLNTLLPIAENFFGRSASALGKVADEGIRMITSGPWKRDFRTISENNYTVITNMARAGLSLANVFRNIAIAAGPFTTWITRALKEGADAFADWSAQARSNGSIADFLDETKESLQSLWQIFKNLGSIVSSFFNATVDEGQSYLRTLEDITGHWADVADAQEQANSPLREWMTNIRPVLSALGDLIRDLARGIGNLASNQSNIQTMIDLLDTLRTRVLPPILEILQHLNDSGIAVTVAEALGDMLEAISTFLESGAASALTVFVTVLANFAELLFNIASLPGVSNVLGGLAAGLAALAAVSIVARFTGLFKLWDFFTWMVRNRGNLSGAFADAARNAAGLQSSGQSAPIARNTPSPIAGIGSEIVGGGNTARSIENTGRAAENANGKVSVFSRTVGGLSTAGSRVQGALGGLVGFLGGPWGIALSAAAVGVTFLVDSLMGQRREAEDTKNAFQALKSAYSDLSQGNTDQVNQLAETDKKFKELAERAERFGVSLTDVSGALNDNDQNLTRVNTQLDAQIATYERLRIAALEAGGPTAAIPYKQLKDEAIEFKDSINQVAEAQSRNNELTKTSADSARTYQDRLAGMTQAQVDSVVAAGDLEARIQTLSSALDTMSSATSTARDRSSALSDIIKAEYGEMMTANEATENWNSQILTLKESVEANGKSLSVHSREGLRNRDALQAAAKAARDLYLEDIASGVPMKEATQRHRDRIKELQKEADKALGTKKETRDLIKMYGEVPEDVQTELSTKGYVKVYQEMQDLKALQASLQSGKSLKEAEREVEESKARASMKGWGDGYGAPGFRSGGPVWGAGTRTSDSIRAWLSNGEFVHPTDAVEYYGLPVMEALRQKKLDRTVVAEALPDVSNDKFASGGTVHSKECPICASGGHKFAKGGGVGWPFPVDVSDTMIKKAWAEVGLGGAGGPGGYKWQMQVLRQRFPGLPLISGPRPGARTLSGNRSYHALGRAVDLPPRRDVAQWIRSNFGARTKELITPYNDLNIWNGKPHRYTGAVWNQHNFAGGNPHDHWAFNQGGLVDLMEMLNMQNIMPKQQTSLPTTPRTLSPAASSVVNNSTDNTRTFGDVIINNPMPERAGDSIRDALYRTQLLY